MTEQQLNIILEQNAQLLEQNRQLIAMLSENKPAAHVQFGRKPRVGKKDRIGVQVTSWYGTAEKILGANLSAIVKAKIIKKGLWQG